MPEWRSLPSNPKYLISDGGEVRHINSTAPRRLQRSGSYVYVNFWQEKKLRLRTVHSLVAETFLGPRPPGSEVRHLDGDPLNNRVENLAYGTRIENAADRERHARTAHGERNGNAAIRDADARTIRLIHRAGVATQDELADAFGISQAQIHNIVRWKQRKRAAEAP
jgi:hypothetical protein